MSGKSSGMAEALRFGVMVLFGLLILAPAIQAAEESFIFRRFGSVKLYSAGAKVDSVVLLVSGDKGWDRTCIDMARSLLEYKALVIGIDSQAYLKEIGKSVEACSYPASDLVELSRFAQKKTGLAEEIMPVLAGYQTGAALAYAALAEAQPKTFLGGISLGFSPKLDLSKPLCRGNALEWTAGPRGQGLTLLPCPSLETPWIMLQGRIDQAFPEAAARDFAGRTRSAQLIPLPKVGHDFAPDRSWMVRFQLAFRTLSLLRPATKQAVIDILEDLPLIEAPAPQGNSELMAFTVTGDGGYGPTDRGLAEGLAAHGIPVVALNSLKYFWVKKTPDGAGRDLERILRHYLSAWKKNEIVMAGFSLGAEVLPFMISRLPDDLRAKVKLVALLGPSQSVNFEFHLTDWLASKTRVDDLPVLPEIGKLGDVVLLCFYGEKDRAAICNRIKLPKAKSIPIESGHRFGRTTAPVLEAILREIDKIIVR